MQKTENAYRNRSSVFTIKKGSINELFLLLDGTLTRKNQRILVQTARNSEQKLQDLTGWAYGSDPYFLSDNEDSRVYWDP